MSNIIYWEEYKEPKTYTDPISKKEVSVSGKYVCSDDRVERVWITMGLGAIPKDGDASNSHYANYDCIVCCQLLMKDGYRKQYCISSNWENIPVEKVINEAEKYLESLPKQNP